MAEHLLASVIGGSARLLPISRSWPGSSRRPSSPGWRKTASSRHAWSEATSAARGHEATQAAHELGLDVPSDVSIGDFNDLRSACDESSTTIRLPLRKMGETALEVADSQKVIGSIVLEVELVVRASTGPPRS